MGHSFSGKFFSEKFAKEGIEAIYENFQIDDISDLDNIIASHPDLAGLNVTLPYKRSVMSLLNYIDPAAAGIGAVNVIKIGRSKDAPVLSGYNTDLIGFTQSVKPLLSANDKKALVLGSGGASAAVAKALGELNLEVLLVSRMAGHNKISYSDLDGKLMSEATVIVNTTPLGMFPDIGSYPPVPYDKIDNRHLCYDLVYNPELTLFLEKSMERGARIMGGMEMLIGQAVAAWDIWNSESFK